MEKIYDTYWERLFDLAFYKTGDEDLATEIVQEVLISLWENKRQISIETSLNAYLSTAVKYRVLNYYKASSIRKEHQEQLGKLADLVMIPDAEDLLVGREIQSEIDLAVEELPEKMQAVFRLSKIAGKSNQEIADELEISLQTVKNQLSSALKILRKSLSYMQTLFLLFLTQS